MAKNYKMSSYIWISDKIKHNNLNKYGDPAGGHDRQGNKFGWGENESLVQMGFVSLDQDFGEPDVRWFIPNKCEHSITWKSFLL